MLCIITLTLIWRCNAAVRCSMALMAWLDCCALLPWHLHKAYMQMLHGVKAVRVKLGQTVAVCFARLPCPSFGFAAVCTAEACLAGKSVLMQSVTDAAKR